MYRTHDQNSSGPLGFRDILTILRIRKWTIFTITLLSLAAAVLYSRLQHPVYQSQAEVLVRPIQFASGRSNNSGLVLLDMENETKVFSALSTLPDNAVRELQPGELQQYNVIRVGDEIVVDLMRSAGGIDYAEAAKEVVVREVDSVPIPFASPRLLWRMKAVTHREKDRGDLVFLRQWFAERGEEPPKV